MHQFLHSWLAIASIILPSILLAQYPVVVEADTIFSANVMPTWEGPADQVQVLDGAKEWQEAAWNAGFLAADFNIRQTDSTWLVTLLTGKWYKWVTLRGGNLPLAVRTEVQFQERYFAAEPIEPMVLQQLFTRIVQVYEESGYPFVSVCLDSLQTDSGRGIKAALHVTPGPLIEIDTFQLSEDVSISTQYLARYLGVVPGEPYRESRIRAIEKRINDLPFLQCTRPPEVLFIRNRATIRLYVKEVQASTFNFLIGILPNSTQTNGRLLVNGEATLRMENPFGHGRSLSVDWKNLQPRSPQFKAALAWPYLFNSPVGVDGTFQLFKRDTFWVDVEGTVGLRYALDGSDYLRFFVKRKVSNLISIDTQQVRLTQTLPDRLDLRYNWIGLSYARMRLDYRFNPRKGYKIEGEISGGSRTIRPNPLITAIANDQVDYNVLYDEANAGALSGSIQLLVEKYWSIGRQSTLLTAYEGGYLYAASIWTNELYRIGGNKLLRGFDEESILASQYHIVTAEYRYLLDRNAYLNFFADAGYIERRAVDQPLLTNMPVGIGGGIAFATGAGIFEVNYALGRLNADNPFALRRGRVHLGYVSYF